MSNNQQTEIYVLEEEVNEITSDVHIRPGYKHTLLGWIPEEWEVKSLAEVAAFFNGRAYKQEELLLSGKYKVLRVGNFFTNGDWYYSDMELEESKYVSEGDLMYAWSASFGPKYWHGGKTIYHYHIWKVVPSAQTDKAYLYHSLLFDTERILASKQGGTMFHVTKGDMEKRNIAVPKLPEQRAIATLLTTWDTATALTSQLLAQKELRKKWLMQQLLTGKKRLPGFTGVWKRQTINSIAKEVSIRNKSNQDMTVLSCTKYDGLVPSLEYFGRRIFSEDVSTYKVVPRHCFAYATNHIEEGSIGYQVDFDEALISPMYTVFQTSDIVDDYLFRLLKSHHYIHEYQKRMEGSIDRRGGLRWEEFSKIKIPVPAIEEQEAIAAFFQKVDYELTLLRKKLEQLNEQKKGLMQVLLTGKVRVNHL